MTTKKLISRAIMKTDIKGFSNRVGLLSDLELSKLLTEHKDFIKRKIKKYFGKIIKGEGDAFWITFESATHAVKSAIEIQNELRDGGVGKKENARLAIRISISLGDILEQEKDIFGNAVNLCARIEGITPSDEIYLSNSTYLSVNQKDINISYIGEFSFKGFKNKEKLYKINLKHNTVTLSDTFIVFTDLENFRSIASNRELTENLYDEYERLIQLIVEKYDASIINILGDAFLLRFNDVNNMFRAIEQILKRWDKYLLKNNLKNYVRIGVHKGTIIMYRTLVMGVDMNITAKLESYSKNFNIKNRKSIASISKKTIAGLRNEKIKNILKKVPIDDLNKQFSDEEINEIEEVYVLYNL